MQLLLNFLTESASLLKNENTIDMGKVDWDVDWDIHKAVRSMGFRSWVLLEPGN